MAPPLALAVPAAAAGLAYLDAKMGVSYDMRMLGGVLPAAFNTFMSEWRDRINAFYRFEQAAQSRASADVVFLRCGDRNWTFAQAYDMVLRYATLLKTRFGVKARDIVALDMQNSDTFVLLTLALWALGAKPAYINFNLTDNALAHCVSVAKSVMMLVDPEVAGNVTDEVRSKLDGLRIELVTPELEAAALASDPVRPPDEVRAGDQAKDLAILIYTSGTTGLPKAAIVSWGKITRAASFISHWLKTKPSDVFYTSMPLYHSSGAVFGFCHCMFAGCTFAIGKKFSTKIFWKDVRRYDATMIQYVGETCRYLLAAPPERDPSTGEDLDRRHRVRVAFGNGLRPDVWERFKERFGIETVAEFYGATEGPSATWNLARNDFATGAIGRHGSLWGLLLGMRVAVAEVDEEGPVRDPRTGRCRRLPRGSGVPGELLWALPEAEAERDFQGYFNNAGATNSKIMRGAFREGDAWYRTGDLVTWDGEGRFYFQDRLGDTFRWKSENVATTEVAAAMGSHPLVNEANVYGVQLPHHDGRAGAAALELSEPLQKAAAAAGGIEAGALRELAAHARARLPRYAVPVFLRVGPGVGAAVTGTNKQQKHELRTQGVDPDRLGADEIYWLRDGTYVRFGREDWDALNRGQIKL